MIFVPTFLVALVLLALTLAGVISVSFWAILAVFPGIWIAWWLCVGVIFGILALIAGNRRF